MLKYGLNDDACCLGLFVRGIDDLCIDAHNRADCICSGVKVDRGKYRVDKNTEAPATRSRERRALDDLNLDRERGGSCGFGFTPFATGTVVPD
jgi:hypothetical protein